MATQERDNDQKAKILRWVGIAVGLTLPSLITWGYFDLAAGLPKGWQQTIYLSVKVFQFAFPLGWVLFALRERIAARSPTSRGLAAGISFGLAVAVAGWTVYSFALRDLPMFATASQLVLDKVHSFGIDTVWKYALLAGFYSLIHSLLEEYYWRWFVYGQLRKLVPFAAAIAISAIGFAGHHVIVLAIFFGVASAATWLLSGAIVVGGVFWAWLYERTGSLVGPWLSHLVIDAGIFWIGYELIRGGLSAGVG